MTIAQTFVKNYQSYGAIKARYDLELLVDLRSVWGAKTELCASPSTSTFLFPDGSKAVWNIDYSDWYAL